MFSLAVKSHWKLALRTVKKAFKVTINEIINNIRLNVQLVKRSDDLIFRRKILRILERWNDEQRT